MTTTVQEMALSVPKAAKYLVFDVGMIVKDSVKVGRLADGRELCVELDYWGNVIGIELD